MVFTNKGVQNGGTILLVEDGGTIAMWIIDRALEYIYHIIIYHWYYYLWGT